ncbi:MAG: PhnD/SsuA/transferrin family substrate-binding protein [Acidobacteriota bacterium]
MRGRTRCRLLAALALAVVLPSAAGGEEAVEEPLRLGVVTFYNPRLMFVKYQPLVDFLTAHTGRTWMLDISHSYDETVDNLCRGRLTLAYLGPLTYLRAHALCSVEPLLRLRTRGRLVFYSDVLVRSDSPFERIEELAGHRVGFGDPLSTSSHLVPRSMLQDAGLEPGRDFECRYYGQHERAARAVLMGEVEACGVRDIIGELFLHRGLRRLARSGPVPAYPLVASPEAPRELRETLTSVLLGFPGEARPRLDEERWDLELTGGFTRTVDSDYDPVRRLAERVFGPGFATRPERELRCR